MTTHRQHYVPQMYLKNFATGKMCFVLDEYNKIREKSIRSICWENNLYELRSKNGNIVKENLYENMFSQQETKFATLIRKLLNVLKNNDSLSVFLNSENNEGLLIQYIASLFLRNPDTMQEIGNFSSEMGISQNELQKKNNAIVSNSLIIKDFADGLYSTHKITILENKTEVDFITSSFPGISIRDEYGYIEYLFPLTPQYCVLLVDKNSKKYTNDFVQIVCEEKVDELNTIAFKYKNKYVIAKKKETLEKYI